MQHRTLILVAIAAATLVPLPAPAQVGGRDAGAGPGRKPAGGAPVVGVVTRVIDGDTLVLQPPGKAPLEVRLRDIDAPESCQAWGPESRRALEEYALGRTAELRAGARDAYGRTLGGLSVDGQDIGSRMVTEGHAWSIRTRWDTGPLVKQERQAIALRRGLHATPGAVMPKLFREATRCPVPGPR